MTMHYAKMLYVIGAFIGIWNLSLANTDPLPTQRPRACGPRCPLEPLETTLTSALAKASVYVTVVPSPPWLLRSLLRKFLGDTEQSKLTDIYLVL